MISWNVHINLILFCTLNIIMWITLFWFVSTNKRVTNCGLVFVCFVVFCFWWNLTTPFCSFMNGSYWIYKSFSVSKATVHKAQNPCSRLGHFPEIKLFILQACVLWSDYLLHPTHRIPISTWKHFKYVPVWISQHLYILCMTV